jgi:hypothetical protein
MNPYTNKETQFSEEILEFLKSILSIPSHPGMISPYRSCGANMSRVVPMSRPTPTATPSVSSIEGSPRVSSRACRRDRFHDHIHRRNGFLYFGPNGVSTSPHSGAARDHQTADGLVCPVSSARPPITSSERRRNKPTEDRPTCGSISAEDRKQAEKTRRHRDPSPMPTITWN